MQRALGSKGLRIVAWQCDDFHGLYNAASCVLGVDTHRPVRRRRKFPSADRARANGWYRIRWCTFHGCEQANLSAESEGNEKWLACYDALRAQRLCEFRQPWLLLVELQPYLQVQWKICHPHVTVIQVMLSDIYCPSKAYGYKTRAFTIANLSNVWYWHTDGKILWNIVSNRLDAPREFSPVFIIKSQPK